MKGISAYIIKPELPARKAGAFSVDAGAGSLPTKGTIISAPPGGYGRLGDPVWFQYTASTDPELWADDTRLIVQLDELYMVASRMLNDWLFYEMTAEGEDGERLGIVLSSEHRVYKPGMRVVVARGLSHRVIPKMFSDRNLYAVKSEYVILYID